MFHFVREMELRCLSDLMYFQSVPGTGDKDKEEDKGMTIEEKKEAERQRWGGMFCSA